MIRRYRTSPGAVASAAPGRPTGPLRTARDRVAMPRHPSPDSAAPTHSTQSITGRPPVPVAIKQRDDTGDETGEKRIFFRTVPVFDVSMTDPLPGMEPVPLMPPSQPITGDSHRDLIGALTKLASELGYSVDVRQLPDGGPGGCCDPKRHEIVVGSGPANRELRTLVHEVSHALGIGYEQYGREQAEVLVDCVTYVSAPRSASTWAANRSPTSPAGAKTAPSTRSANTQRRSTRSRAASKTPSTRSPNPRARRSLVTPSRSSSRARSVGAAAPPR
jgi:hypothetical protein